MDKSPDAFRTISEVSELLDTPAHVLRFWESRFPQIKPVKRAGGRRYYRPADMALLSGIRRLLHDEGLTIRGVQKILREQGVKHVSGLAEDEESDAVLVDADAEGQDAAVETTAPIALFPTKPIAEPEPAPEAEPLPTDAVNDAVNDAVSDQTETALAKAALEADALGTVEQDDHETPTPDALSLEGEIALEEALSGPFAATDTPAETPPEPVATPYPQTSDAAARPELRAAEPDRDAPQFPFDTPASAPPVAPVEETAEPDKPSESSGPFEGAAAADNTETPAEITAKVGADGPAMPDKPSLPGPLPVFQEISGHWLPADLRGLHRGALAPKRVEAEALMRRLEQLRNRVGDLGRVPRR